MLRSLAYALAALFTLGCTREPEPAPVVEPAAGPQAQLTEKEALGKILFFDRNLSLKGNQACSSCHLPEAGWSGDNSAINAHGAAGGNPATQRRSEDQTAQDQGHPPGPGCPHCICSGVGNTRTTSIGNNTNVFSFIYWF